MMRHYLILPLSSLNSRASSTLESRTSRWLSTRVRPAAGRCRTCINIVPCSRYIRMATWRTHMHSSVGRYCGGHCFTAGTVYMQEQRCHGLGLTTGTAVRQYPALRLVRILYAHSYQGLCPCLHPPITPSLSSHHQCISLCPIHP